MQGAGHFRGAVAQLFVGEGFDHARHRAVPDQRGLGAAAGLAAPARTAAAGAGAKGRSLPRIAPSVADALLQSALPLLHFVAGACLGSALQYQIDFQVP
jgi:hypothetical protein